MDGTEAATTEFDIPAPEDIAGAEDVGGEEARPPEPVAPAERTEDRSEKPVQMVPAHLLAEMRQERNQLREERRQERDALLKLVQQVQGKTPQDAKAPDPNEDPVNYIISTLQNLEREQNETRAERAARLEAEKQQKLLEAFSSYVRSDYERYAASDAPDLYDSAQFLAESIAVPLRKVGWPEGNIKSFLHQLEQQMVVDGHERGMTPGQALYDAAKRAGYTPKADVKRQEEAAAKRAKAEAGGRGIGGGGTASSGMTKTKVLALSQDWSVDQKTREKAMKLVSDLEAFAKLPD